MFFFTTRLLQDRIGWGDGTLGLMNREALKRGGQGQGAQDTSWAPGTFFFFFL
jgi:hypothetical protein